MSCGPEGEVVTDVALYRPEHLEDHLQQQAVSAEHGRKRRWHLSTLLSGLLVAVLALATPALMPLLGRRMENCSGQQPATGPDQHRCQDSCPCYV